MYTVVLLCSVIGTSLGFWKIYSKDQVKKTKNASGYKVVLLFLCLLLSCFFYIKTYQVATLKNIVVIKGYKGSFNETGSEYKDTISIITFYTKFVDKKWQEDLYLQDMGPDLKSSGMLMFVKLNNDSSAHHYYFEDGKAIVSSLTDSLKHMYEVTHAATAIPTLFPFSSPIPQSFVNEDPTGVSIVAHNKSIDDIEKILDETPDNKMPSWVANSSSNIGMYSSNLIYTHENPFSKEDDYWFRLSNTYTEGNKFSIFSLADLSQCNFEFRIKTDIPVCNLSLFLDVPAEFGALDIVRDNVIDNGFTIGNLDKLHETGDGFLRVHAKLPTQENLQLIRSLVLTTIVTALFSMFLSNCYYYFRKRIKEKEKKVTYKSRWRNKLKIRFFWFVAGQRLALFLFALLIIWILMLHTNLLISIPQKNFLLVCILAISIVVLIIALIISISYYNYQRFIKRRYNVINDTIDNSFTNTTQNKQDHRPKKRSQRTKSQNKTNANRSRPRTHEKSQD